MRGKGIIYHKLYTYVAWETQTEAYICTKGHSPAVDALQLVSGGGVK